MRAAAVTHEVMGFDPRLLAEEVDLVVSKTELAWAEEDHHVAAAYGVVMQHAAEVGLSVEQLEPTTAPRGRPGAQSFAPAPGHRGPHLPHVLGRLHHGTAYFGGHAPPSAFMVAADGSVVPGDGEAWAGDGEAPSAPQPFVVPCFGPPALVSDGDEYLSLPVRRGSPLGAGVRRGHAWAAAHELPRVCVRVCAERACAWVGVTFQSSGVQRSGRCVPAARAAHAMRHVAVTPSCLCPPQSWLLRCRSAAREGCTTPTWSRTASCTLIEAR